MQVMSKSRLELHLELVREERYREKAMAVWYRGHGMVLVEAAEKIYKGDLVVMNANGTVSRLEG